MVCYVHTTGGKDQERECYNKVSRLFGNNLEHRNYCLVLYSVRFILEIVYDTPIKDEHFYRPLPRQNKT